MNEVETNNGRIVLHDPKWYPGANLPAVQQPAPVAPRGDTLPDVVQAIDYTLEQAHWLFWQEYSRQLRMYQAYNGRPPCYHYEFASVAEHAKAALPQAVRAYLR